MSKNDKQHTLVPRLRFPQFRDSEGWGNVRVADAVKTVTPPTKLKTNQYNEAGRYPVIDQSADAICGWTDDEEAVIREPLPMIVFGDHTCVLKKADAPFAQGADGIKILVGRNGFDTDFLYQMLCARPLKSESYKRHFSKLKLVEAPKPPSPNEQRKVADCLGSLDDLMAAEERKLAALRDHKKGLMQQIFPREGETRPRLRFPEFRKRQPWKERQVGDVFKVTRGQVLAMPLLQARKSDKTPYPVYSSRTKENGLSGYYSEYLFEDAITWTTDGANAGDVNFRRGKFYCTNVCGVLISEEGFANECIAALLNNVACNHVSYVGNPKLMNGVMVKIVIPFPERDEQDRIADCLASLDAIIVAQAEKLDALRTHKRGLMQQLFPSAEDAEA